MSLNWKSSEILRVSGSIVKEGVFTGHEAGNQSKLVGKFTPDVIAKMFDNITEHIPLYVGHDSTNPKRRLVGYAYKFGKTPTNDDIQVEGFVFDPQAQRKIITEGWDSFSPEIEFTNDESGNHVNAFATGLAFVPNPAIDGTQASKEITVFSNADDKEGNMSTIEFLKSKGLTDAEIVSVKKGLFEEGSSNDTPPAAEATPPPPKPTPTTTTPPHAGMSAEQRLKQVENELADTRSKLEDSVVKNEQLLGMQYDTLVGELKSLGFDNPSEIVKTLPTESKIAVLSKLKAGAIKKKEMAKPSENPGNASDSATNPSQDQLINEALKDLGIPRAEYDKVMGGKV